MDKDYTARPKSNNLSLNEATGVAQNGLLWRLASTFGAKRSYRCMLEMICKL